MDVYTSRKSLSFPTESLSFPSRVLTNNKRLYTHGLVSPLSSLLSPLTIGLDLILLPSIELIQAGLALSELSQMGGENNLPIKLS